MMIGACLPVAARAQVSGEASPEAGTVDVPRVADGLDLGAILAGLARPNGGALRASEDVLSEFGRVADFTQQSPTDGAPSSYPTDVHLAYDTGHLYAVFLARDPEPTRIRAHLAPRENIGGDDVVTIMLDTDHDGRRAYAFRANARGIQWDALWTEGQGFDDTFDTVWDVEAALTPFGYAVGFQIPFKSLRFDASNLAAWGLVLSRSVPREEGEVSYWPRVSSHVQGTLTQAADLVGLTRVEASRNVQAIGYTNARSFRALDRAADGGPRYVRDPVEAEAGVDVKAVLDDRFVVDLTLKPDFSQVESDQPQVSVNQRFELFFPERRPFFTENADYFQTPINVLFTRRIADPDLGSRFTGRAGPWSIGALVIDDEAPGQRVPRGDPLHGASATFAAARLSRDLGEFSRIGAVYVDRSLEGAANRVGGMDGRVRLDDHWTGTAQAVWSGSTDLDGARRDGAAGTLSIARSGRSFNYFGNVQALDRDFEALGGFVTRTGIRRTNHFASFFHRPGNALLSWGPEVFVSRIWDEGGRLRDEITEASLEWSFVGGTYLEINGRAATDRLGPEDHPSLTALRAYDTGMWDIEYGTSHWDWLQVGGNLRFGSQVNLSPVAGEEPEEADFFQLNLGTSVRPTTRLRVDNTLLWTALEDGDGAGRVFRNLILRTRWNWQFTRELSARAIVQYEDTSVDPERTSLEPDRNLNGDVLLTYRLNPWTAVYLGANVNGRNVDLVSLPGEGRILRRVDALRQDTHQIFIKASYLLRF